MKRVGALYDVIGPVKAPYGLIKTSRADPNEVVGGKPIYVTAKDLEKRASRENRRERRGGRREAGRGN